MDAYLSDCFPPLVLSIDNRVLLHEMLPREEGDEGEEGDEKRGERRK